MNSNSFKLVMTDNVATAEAERSLINVRPSTIFLGEIKGKHSLFLRLAHYKATDLLGLDSFSAAISEEPDITIKNYQYLGTLDKGEMIALYQKLTKHRL